MKDQSFVCHGLAAYEVISVGIHDSSCHAPGTPHSLYQCREGEEIPF